MSTRAKLLLALGVWIGGTVLLGVLFGSAGRNEEFQPTEEFRLEPWIELGPLDVTKAVLYLLIAAALTVGTMLYIANRMQARPNRVQTAVETVFLFMRDNIAGGNMDRDLARR